MSNTALFYSMGSMKLWFMFITLLSTSFTIKSWYRSKWNLGLSPSCHCKFCGKNSDTWVWKRLEIWLQWNSLTLHQSSIQHETRVSDKLLLRKTVWHSSSVGRSFLAVILKQFHCNTLWPLQRQSKSSIPYQLNEQKCISKI